MTDTPFGRFMGEMREGWRRIEAAEPNDVYGTDDEVDVDEPIPYVPTGMADVPDDLVAEVLHFLAWEREYGLWEREQRRYR